VAGLGYSVEGLVQRMTESHDRPSALYSEPRRAVRVNRAHLCREMVRRGWRANDLAQAASLSPGTLTAILHGRSVSPQTLRRWR
jgi:phage replication-related protein YjqB (UPF0714/DUF867 family)